VSQEITDGNFDIIFEHGSLLINTIRIPFSISSLRAIDTASPAHIKVSIEREE
jgi:hypothetical protein